MTRRVSSVVILVCAVAVARPAAQRGEVPEPKLLTNDGGRVSWYQGDKHDLIAFDAVVVPESTLSGLLRTAEGTPANFSVSLIPNDRIMATLGGRPFVISTDRSGFQSPIAYWCDTTRVPGRSSRRNFGPVCCSRRI